MNINIRNCTIADNKAVDTDAIPSPYALAKEAMTKKLGSLGLDVDKTMADIDDIRTQMIDELKLQGESCREPHDLETLLRQPISNMDMFGQRQGTNKDAAQAAIAVLRYLGVQFAAKGYHVDHIVNSREFLKVSLP